MNAFIALEKYIVKQEKEFGIGVPVTLDEDIAMYESQRKKNVQSYNNWLLINIPGNNFFIDAAKSINEQSDDILNVLMDKKFILSLFVHEGRTLLEDMGNRFKGENVKEETDRIFDEFAKEKYDFLFKFSSGLDLFNFVNSKCKNHDKGKSSALLYSHGIKGFTYQDETGDRLFLFNAKKDISPLEYRSASLIDSKLIS
ncbi:hypothetical protein [Treponema pectinovorum]|uniref:hypothetical protein n=1 Tax=Treponema pectinovorum TaxID=164 RepID=UPI0011F22CB5|nr:hypothetical protein [Treponema pectinovorum]